MAQWSGVWQRAWRIIVALVLTSATLLSLGAPEVSACYTWQVGARVGLREGAQIRTGPGLAYAVHTTLQPGVSDWPVDIIDGPRYADGREWWDTSRVHVDGGGTGWVDKAQAAWDLCSSNPQPDPGNVYVQSGLELQPDPNHSWPPLEGDNLIGRFTIGNNGGQSIRIDRHGVRLFRNGSENLSFLNNGGSVDLSPGQTVRFDQNNEYHLPTGHYRAEITWQVNNQWHVTDAREFDVAARPDPYNVYVASGLELVPDPNHGWPPVVGDKLIGRFTLGNNGGQGVQLERYGVRLFRNGTENLSFLNNGGSVYLSPGQTVRFDQNNEYQLSTGHYRAEITWQIGGQWHVTAGQEFDVLAAQTPGGLALAEPLSFTSEGSGQWPPRQGDKIIARIRVANVGDQSLHVPYIGVRGRRNGWETLDIGWFSVDIAGHSTWSLDANNEHALEQGDYAFRVSYSLDGQDWVELGNEVTFSVGAAVTPVPGITPEPVVTPEPGPPGESAVTVVDPQGQALSGAEVYRRAAGSADFVLAGTTGANGRLELPALHAGEELIARYRIGYVASPRSNHNQDASQDWAYRVYITSMAVQPSGAVLPYRVGSALEQPVLRLLRENTLIGFNIVVSVEWDASAEYLDEVQQGFQHASEYLYRATNGQMLFEQVTIYDDSLYERIADYRVLATNAQRPVTWGTDSDPAGILKPGPKNVVDLGRYWCRHGGRFGSWRDPDGHRTIIHEFGHYGLHLWDSYVDPNGHETAYCTSTEILEDDTAWQTSATLMYWSYNAAQFAMRGVDGLWSDSCTNTMQYYKTNESDWETIVRWFSDKAEPGRWLLKTPQHHGAVVPGPSSIPARRWTVTTVVDYAYSGTCETPQPYEVQYDDGTPAAGVEVSLQSRVSGVERTIRQGITDEQGRITVLGAADGDRVLVQTGEGQDLLEGAIEVQCSAGPAGSWIAGGSTPRSAAEVIVLDRAAFDLSVVVRPGSRTTEALVYIQAPAALPGGPTALFSQHGAETAVAVALVDESAIGVYTGRIALDPNLRASGDILARGVDAQGRAVEVVTSFSLDEAVRAQDLLARSADGHAEVFLPADSLSTSGMMVIEPAWVSDASASRHVLIGGPYTVEGTAGLSFNGFPTLTLSFHAADPMISASTARLFRWSGIGWQPLDSTVSVTHQSVSASITSFGTYAAFGEPGETSFLPLVTRR